MASHKWKTCVNLALKEKQKDVKWAKTITYLAKLVPIFALNVSPILSIYAIYHRIDPIYFIFNKILKIPKSFKFQFSIKLFSFIILALSGVNISQILLGLAYLVLILAWFTWTNFKLLDALHKATSSCTKTYTALW